MAGCGRVCNGQHEVAGLPLRCGVNLYWRLAGASASDKNRQSEAVLCEACRKVGTLGLEASDAAIS
jgi:hypothetical protein